MTIKKAKRKLPLHDYSIVKATVPWQRVKLSMTVRAAGTTFENRQERLQFLKQFQPEDLSITLEREPENKFDSNAIQIVVHIKPISRKTVIGYVPRGLAKELAKVMDAGIHAAATLVQIIGGYEWKESLGALINITV
jgi:hypothetical protein